MEIRGWKYYNYAAIPTTAPHEKVNIAAVNDGSIWKMQGKPLLARWTSDFDCGYETNWWYVIKDEPFDITALKSKRRYEINKGKKNFKVELINAFNYKNELFDITVAAYSSWPEKYRPNIDKERFLSSLNLWSKYFIYGAFSVKDDKLCGYANVQEFDTYFEFISLRVKPDMESKGINAAIVAKILEDYTNNGLFHKYICDGARNIRHETNFQNYLEKYFGFRKAYCNLHVVYNPKIKWIIKILFPFRMVLQKFDRIGFIHQVNSVLYMEYLCRNGVNYK